MDTLDKMEITRRGLLAGTGFLMVSFSVSRAIGQEASQPAETPAAKSPPLPGGLADDPYLDSWIKIGADSHITVFTGKAELGQGIKTALIQLAAEELQVEPADIEMITADTGRTPNEGYTAGSQSITGSGVAIRNAAAQVRDLLIAQAANRFRARRKYIAGQGQDHCRSRRPLRRLWRTGFRASSASESAAAIEVDAAQRVALHRQIDATRRYP